MADRSDRFVRGQGGRPSRIVIERLGGVPRWRFEVLNEEGGCIDYSLGSTRGLVWRMACRSWRRAERRATDGR